jgi:hypothetical protein
MPWTSGAPGQSLGERGIVDRVTEERAQVLAGCHESRLQIGVLQCRERHHGLGGQIHPFVGLDAVRGCPGRCMLARAHVQGAGAC